MFSTNYLDSILSAVCKSNDARGNTVIIISRNCFSFFLSICFAFKIRNTKSRHTAAVSFSVPGVAVMFSVFLFATRREDRLVFSLSLSLSFYLSKDVGYVLVSNFSSQHVLLVRRISEALVLIWLYLNINFIKIKDINNVNIKHWNCIMKEIGYY